MLVFRKNKVEIAFKVERHAILEGDIVETIDVVSGLVKAGIFGFIVTLMGCYHGYYSRGGAQGVGIATTNAVVSSAILILVANYLVTESFFSK